MVGGPCDYTLYKLTYQTDATVCARDYFSIRGDETMPGYMLTDQTYIWVERPII
jgi:hypothetical protein